jgi:hypothetical protein
MGGGSAALGRQGHVLVKPAMDEIHVRCHLLSGLPPSTVITPRLTPVMLKNLTRLMMLQKTHPR